MNNGIPGARGAMSMGSGLCYSEGDLESTLQSLADGLGFRHISYMPLSKCKNAEDNLLLATVTYSRAWRIRYFERGYVMVDPVVERAFAAVMPFDWTECYGDGVKVRRFLNDAQKHGAGVNGISLPVRNRDGETALVSFASDLVDEKWIVFRNQNLSRLQVVANMIHNSASGAAGPPVVLTGKEEQCLTWAARGKTLQEIANEMGLPFQVVKLTLDVARHRLQGFNLPHAIKIAAARSLIPVDP